MPTIRTALLAFALGIPTAGLAQSEGLAGDTGSSASTPTADAPKPKVTWSTAGLRA